MDKEHKAVVIPFSSIVENNGRTIKENNLLKPHKIPIGTLVELASGERLYIGEQIRDCDGTPLYTLCRREDVGKLPTSFTERMFFSGIIQIGFSEKSLLVIMKDPNE